MIECLLQVCLDSVLLLPHLDGRMRKRRTDNGRVAETIKVGSPTSPSMPKNESGRDVQNAKASLPPHGGRVSNYGGRERFHS